MSVKSSGGERRTHGSAVALKVDTRGPMNDSDASAFIRLADLLKLAGIADSGGHAKALIQGGGVVVNGAVEARRGRKLRVGDRVSVDKHTVTVDAGMLMREP